MPEPEDGEIDGPRHEQVLERGLFVGIHSHAAFAKPTAITFLVLGIDRRHRDLPPILEQEIHEVVSPPRGAVEVRLRQVVRAHKHPPGQYRLHTHCADLECDHRATKSAGGSPMYGAASTRTAALSGWNRTSSPRPRSRRQ